jgi:hypothetical protein
MVFRWLLVWMGAFCLLLTGCDSQKNEGDVVPPSVVAQTPLPVVTHGSSPTPELTDIPETTVAPTMPPETPVPDPGEPIVLPTDDLGLSADSVFIYPAVGLVVGDRATIQIYPHIPPGLDPAYIPVRILVDGDLLIDTTLGRMTNLGGEPMGLFPWVWLVGETPRTATLTVWLDPDDVLRAGDENPFNNRVDLAVPIAPRAPEQLPDEWLSLSTERAVLYMVRGTAAERDHAFLAGQVDAALSRAAAILGIEQQGRVTFYFVDRVLGHGGFTSSGIVISYSDRTYTGTNLTELLVHEAVHALDRQFVQGSRLHFLTEGIAVWATGGHYKQEPLDQRAAALLFDTGRYIPLTLLVDNFYPAQHEIGYLQAGAFFNYLVRTYGQERVLAFYANLIQPALLTPSEVLNQNLAYHFGRSLTQLEQDWHTWLRTLPRTAEDGQDLLMTVALYDAVRRYQLQFDPTAHFLLGWVPVPEALLSYNLTAELTRRPDAEINRVLEIMLMAAHTALDQRDYNTARAFLDSLNRSMDQNGRLTDPLALSFQEVVRAVAQAGFSAETIRFSFADQQSVALVTARAPDDLALVALRFIRSGSVWERID